MNKLDFGPSWKKVGCAFCDADSGYEIFSHEDYENFVLPTCKACGKVYFVESHFKDIDKDNLIKRVYS